MALFVCFTECIGSFTKSLVGSGELGSKALILISEFVSVVGNFVTCGKSFGEFTGDKVTFVDGLLTDEERTISLVLGDSDLISEVMSRRFGLRLLSLESSDLSGQFTD